MARSLKIRPVGASAAWTVSTLSPGRSSPKALSPSLFGSLDGSTTVDAGATLETAGVLDLTNLLGGGQVVDSGAPTNSTLVRGEFFWLDQRPVLTCFQQRKYRRRRPAARRPQRPQRRQHLHRDHHNRYRDSPTRRWRRDRFDRRGAITEVFGGSLIIDRNDALTLDNAISGNGTLQQIGTGVTSINAANAYSSGTTISAGCSPSAPQTRWEPARSQ